MKKLLTICAAAMILAISGLAQALPMPMTLTINGITSGTLGGVAFSDKAFQWTMTYDASNYISPWGTGHPIFLNPTTVITLEGAANPINLTENHGLWVNAGASNLWFAPLTFDGEKPQYNMITMLSEDQAWDGSTPLSINPYIATGGGFSPSLFIATDQGALNMISGSISSLGAAPVPEPATIAVLSLGGLLLRRKKTA